MEQEMAQEMPAGKVLVYDGDCPLCIRGSEIFVRLGIVPEERRRTFQSYDGEVAERLAAAGFRNELAVLEPASGEMKLGIPGFLWLFRDGWLAPLARLLDHRPLVAALTVLYHLVSYNRRILAPPRSAIRCACDPDDRPGYQLALIVLLLVWATAVTALFGAAVAAASDLATAPQGAAWMVLAAGAGWAAVFLAALALPPDVRLRFLGHLGMVMATGVLPLVPAALLAPFLSGPWLAAVVLAAVAASFAVMARQLARRLRYLGLSRGWLAGWAAALWAGAAVAFWLWTP
jgi:hypothetical protein